MCASRVPVNALMPAAQKRRVLRLAEGLGVTPSAYARMAVEAALENPAVEGAVKRIACGGRPTEGCDSQFRFALARPHYDELRRRSDELGIALSAYLRAALSIPCVPPAEGAEPDACYVEVRATLTELRGIRTDLARIGNNVNQIAYGINLMNKKGWLSAQDAGSIFSRWAESTERAEEDLERIEGAVGTCVSALTAACVDYVRVGGAGRCRK